MAQLCIGLVVLFAAVSVIVSSYTAETQRQDNGLHRYKLDVQLLGNNWGTAQATGQALGGPFATESGPSDFAEQRRLGNVRQTSQSGVEDTTDDEEEDDEEEEFPTLENGKLLTELNAYPNINSTAPKRVALLVFGLQRSLPLTLISIKRRVINKLTDVGYEPTVFVHQFEDLGKQDQHSKGVNEAWWTMLRPFAHSVTSQKTFLTKRRCASGTYMSFITHSCESTCLSLHTHVRVHATIHVILGISE